MQCPKDSDNGQADQQDRTKMQDNFSGGVGKFFRETVSDIPTRTIGHFSQIAGTISVNNWDRTTGQADILVGQFGLVARDCG